MSLLQNEDFIIYHLRTSYLQHINDGVGERLININPAILNDPGFRAAGWNPNPPELRRCYSPPIPTAGASEYFKAPARAVRLGESFDEDDEEGGLVTGRPSSEAVGPGTTSKRRRRPRDRDEDDDSSELSDESEAELESSVRPTRAVSFAKMPDRTRSGSSPMRGDSSTAQGPSLFVTEPSKPSDGQELSRASLVNSGPLATRPRRDTTTSSEISSDDPDRSFFAKRSAGKATHRRLAKDQILEEQERQDSETADSRNTETDGTDSDSDSLASDFSEDLGDPSLLEDARPVHQVSISPIAQPHAPDTRSPPKKSRPAPEVLASLPPPRPISRLVPISALTLALKGSTKKASDPLDKYGMLSSTADQNPIFLKMYIPFSTDPETPIELLLKRTIDDKAILVANAIGFALFSYERSKREPALTDHQRNPNNWSLRNVEFGEVDYDFPALSRTRPMSDFLVNNNRPQRPRARDRPWDEFALIEADSEQQEENAQLTPLPETETKAEPPTAENVQKAILTAKEDGQAVGAVDIVKSTPYTTTGANPITDPRAVFATGRKDSLQDLPTLPASHAAERSGTTKTLNIHYTDHSLGPRVTQVQTTTDTYISEVFDQICSRLQLEKGLFVLKVTGSKTVAPSDRTVEALGPDRSSLDLVRRRFYGEFGMSGSASPGSTSPNAPLTVHNDPVLPNKKHHGIQRRPQHPLARQQFTSMMDASDVPGTFADGLGLSGMLSGSGGKRYNVTRRQAMSFSGNQSKVLLFDGEFLHILPGDTMQLAGRERTFEANSNKTTTIHFSNIVGCKVYRKHPKMFRFLVYRERETKRYDFDAKHHNEAVEIVEEIKKGMEPWHSA